ncbi:MFS general substrate transporter [Mollisia scopiformis]|uniref:MFS general substrate transporter n=1 Tax=Mollisia scopiformis TaxID=149040 RepID=A0A194XAT7_MOLSC|nr:MFS general substrate transporter [Mollisia scopiformis]KUJ17280.1 MFS general substrate transporter [Mollisia scopiformis]
MIETAWGGVPHAVVPLHEPSNEKVTNVGDIAPQTASSLEAPRESSASVSAEYEHVYPEGGARAWLVVFGSWCAMFASLGIANTLASFQAYLSKNQLSGYSPGQIGWIFSIYTFLSFACGIYIGPLFDVYGPRWLIVPGSVCVVLSMLLLGVCTALLFTPSVAAVGHFFNRRRGTTTGIATGGGAVGGVVFPLLLESLIPQVGLAWATRIMGFVILCLSMIGILLIKSNLPPSRTAKSPHPDFRILAQPAFFFTVMGSFLMEWALFVPLTYITSYALHAGFNTPFSYQILPILSAGSVFGRFFPGLYSDFIGRFNLILLCTILTIISIFAIWLPFGTTTPGIVVFAVLFGFSSGSNISLTPVCVGQLCKVEEYGRYYATCYTIVSFGCLTGVPIAGSIVQACGGSYWGLIVFTGGCYVGAFVAFAIARGLGGGWRVMMKY